MYESPQSLKPKRTMAFILFLVLSCVLIPGVFYFIYQLGLANEPELGLSLSNDFDGAAGNFVLFSSPLGLLFCFIFLSVVQYLSFNHPNHRLFGVKGFFLLKGCLFLVSWPIFYAAIYFIVTAAFSWLEIRENPEVLADHTIIVWKTGITWLFITGIYILYSVIRYRNRIKP
jgi:hypothetical protein